ncbi:MAG: NTP transferase domain-containing protein, partial [Paracoccaceae bacterium]
MMTQIPAILILAAGSSSRMRGADKLLERIDGVPQIARITQAALATGCPVLVALPPDRPLREKAIAALNVTRITIENAAEGMAASIREGVAHAGNSPGLMILP